MTNVTVHHLDQSRSHRVLWLLEELGVSYRIEAHRRDPSSLRAPPKLRELHPLGKAPIVVIDDEVFAESGAILEHCLDAFDEAALRPPPQTPAFEFYRYFMHYAEGSLMAPLLVRLIFDRVRKAKLPFFVKPIASGIVKKVEATFTTPEIENHARFVEDHLQSHDYFAGDSFSAADIQMHWPVQALLSRGRLDLEVPAMQAWCARVSERPAHQQAIARGGEATPP